MLGFQTVVLNEIECEMLLLEKKRHVKLQQNPKNPMYAYVYTAV